MFLPEQKPPEIVFYNFVNNLNDDDPFWIENEDFNYTKQTVFKNYLSGDLNTAKRWFKDDEFKTLFGENHSRLFNRWKQDNQEKVDEFKESFRKFLRS